MTYLAPTIARWSLNCNNMKKILFACCLALAAIVTLNSCQPDDDNIAPVSIASFIDGPENDHVEYAYTFIPPFTGELSKIVYSWSGEVAAEYVFEDQGNILVVKDASKGDKVAYEISLNSARLASRIVDKAKGTTYSYEYENNRLTRVYDSDGVIVCALTIENGNVTSLTKNGRKKVLTYNNTSNRGNIHTDWYEATFQPRWLCESGLLGNGSEKLCESSKWEDASVTVKYQYKFNRQNAVTRETKRSGAGDSFEYDSEVNFTWHVGALE